MIDAHTRRGSALVVVLILIVVLSSLSAMMLSTAFQKSQSADQVIESAKSLHAAEAGLDMAIAAINTHDIDYVPAYATTAIPINQPVFGSGSYSAEIWRGVDINGNSAQDSGEDLYYRIRSTGIGTRNLGERREVRKTVEAVVVRTRESVFVRAMFGDKGVILAGGAATDSYNSSGAATDHNQGDVGSNGLIEVKTDNVSIHGTLTYGFGIVIPDMIEGLTHLYGDPPWDSLPAPVILTPQAYNPPSGTVPVPAEVTLGSGSTRYKEVQLACGTMDNPTTYRCATFAPSNGAIIHVTGPGKTIIYVDGNVTLQGNTYFQLDNDAHVEIRQGSGDMTIHMNHKAGMVAKPEQLVFISTNILEDGATPRTLTLNGGTDSYGAIYAPTMAFKFNGGGDLHGAVTVRSILFNGQATFHYDEALGNYPMYAYSACQVKSWSEVSDTRPTSHD